MSTMFGYTSASAQSDKRHGVMLFGMLRLRPRRPAPDLSSTYDAGVLWIAKTPT